MNSQPGRTPLPETGPTGGPKRPRPGVDVPDGRGRTGLDQVGRNLAGNPNVVVRDVELLVASELRLRAVS